MKDKQLKAVGIGEILWDLLPDGKQLGGAPTNFAYHANQFGFDSGIISSVGQDVLGEEIISRIKDTAIRNFLTINDNPTGTVSVELDKEGIPSYIIHEGVAWDSIIVSDSAVEFAKDANAVCFGSLAQRNPKSANSIHRILKQMPADAIKVFDINIRQHFYSKEVIEKSLEQANILKINEDEIKIIVNMFNIPGDELIVIKEVIARFDLSYLALTKGGLGSWLVSKQDESYIETPKVKVADTVGAGDSFTATMIAGILNENALKNVHQLAVDVSAFVCTQAGATPTIPDSLKDRL